MLNVWPPLPIELYFRQPYNVNNIIATLEHRDRVRRISIDNPTSSQLKRLAPMMQEPFPALMRLELWTYETAPALPDTFLGGSAPRLQTLDLEGIPFPGLPRLLLSATNLSYLTLSGIPDTGYISPEEMVTGLSALIRLRFLTIRFESRASRPDRHSPPLTRVILPALEALSFQGVSVYLENFMARIDAPRLLTLDISFFNQVVFGIQQLPYVIGHARIVRSSSRAEVIIANDRIQINLYQTDPPNKLQLRIYCRVVYWQVGSMAQICNQLSFLLSIIEQLDIQVGHFSQKSTWQIGMEGMEWLELFRPFTAVRTLRISRDFLPLIVPALRELTGERAMEVLPALDSLYLEDYRASGSKQQAIEPFIAARQHSDHPVAIHHWERR